MRLFGLIALLASLTYAAVNLNTATKEELMELPGIGEAKANAIIEYRSKNKFNSIEDIKNIKGIGDKRYEAIKADLTTSGNTDLSNLKTKANNKTKDIKKNSDKIKELKNNKNKEINKENSKNKKEIKDKKVKIKKDINDKVDSLKEQGKMLVITSRIPSKNFYIKRGLGRLII